MPSAGKRAHANASPSGTAIPRNASSTPSRGERRIAFARSVIDATTLRSNRSAPPRIASAPIGSWSGALARTESSDQRR